MRIRTDVDRIRSLMITHTRETDHFGEMMKSFYRTEKARFPVADYSGVTLRKWLPQRAAIIKRLTQALGGFPQKKVPLRTHVTRRTDRGDFTVEALYFYTRPNWPVSAAFYAPKKRKGKVPGVLLVHGHSMSQKAYPVYQKVATHLVKNGYAVLAVDFVGGGDRKPQEHSNHYMYTAGMTIQGLMVWDNMRAIDYLTSRKEVDAKRIGITGSSGGGNQTAFTTVFDERITASAPVNAVCMFDEHMAVGVDDFCACEVIPDIWTFAEYSDLMATVAPRPLLLVQAVKDRLFPIKGVREVLNRAREVYKAFDKEANIDLAEDYGPHSYASTCRVAVLRWFDKHLKGVEPKSFEEYEDYITCEDERTETLQAWPAGRLPKGTDTLATLFGKAAEKLPDIKRPGSKKAFAAYRRNVRMHISKLAGKPEISPLDTERFASVDSSWATLRPLCFTSERGIVIPSVLIEPKGVRANRVVIHAHPQGKSFTASMIEAEKLIRAGAAVLGLDLRATGETAGYVPSEWSSAEGFLVNRSIMLGRHIAMQRAFDITRAVDCLREIPGYERTPVAVWGEGHAAMSALFAFALDTRIKTLAVSDLLLTFKSSEGFTQDPCIFVPGILRVSDVADVLAASVERPVLVARGELPSGATASDNTGRKILEPAFKAASVLKCAEPRLATGEFRKTQEAIVSFLLE